MMEVLSHLVSVLLGGLFVGVIMARRTARNVEEMWRVADAALQSVMRWGSEQCQHKHRLQVELSAARMEINTLLRAQGHTVCDVEGESERPESERG